jgi:hypothetical protein
MPFEIFALPVIICFVFGLLNGLKAMQKEDEF